MAPCLLNQNLQKLLQPDLNSMNELQVAQVSDPDERSLGNVKVQTFQGIVGQRLPVALGDSQTGHFIGVSVIHGRDRSSK